MAGVRVGIGVGVGVRVRARVPAARAQGVVVHCAYVHARRLEHIVGVEGAVAVDVTQHPRAAAIALDQPTGRPPP
eukprot:scaffold3420_cov40-Phaeocystis_antarctica.AAC.2